MYEVKKTVKRFFQFVAVFFSKGNIVGEPLVGARDEKSYRGEIAAALKSVR